ncbi:MAG: ABC transporter ATP-binding protein [Anaerolineales bacterium]|nr:ABC transporter ATP-binding protein [Anaerolineales bacterium]MCB8937996.1 ABC transporter ATP-binding protein [Ardenticatenaceae bacterium]
MGLEPVISFQNVDKRFAFTKEKPQSVLETFIALFSRRRQPKKSTESLWAVRDVSFDVLPGQCFGIVGRNGSGKSTILKLIARILRPNNGRILINGRVSALLELGAGFHPDLTGRENIFLNAALLGFDEASTHAYYDRIVEFSELGDFIDMPVKHYSSGMYMRLGFSVAIHMQPDILIVDEILAVGDQAFQTKCVNAIMAMKDRGVTIIIVSHNINLVRTLCTHILWIDKGIPQAYGTVDEIAAEYVAHAYQKPGELASVNFARTGSGEIEITSTRFLNQHNEPKDVFATGEPMTIEIGYLAHQPIVNPEIGLAIFRQDGVQVNGPNTKLAGVDLGTLHGAGLVRYEIAQLPLLPATYVVSTAVHDGRSHQCYDFHKQAYNFRIQAGMAEELDGLLQLQAQWQQEKLQPDTV